MQQNLSKLSNLCVIFFGIIPALVLFVSYRTHYLQRPIKEVSSALGLVAVFFLIATLSITPLSRCIFKRSAFIGLRRTFGLFCFFYSFLHLWCFFQLAHEWNLSSISFDLQKNFFLLPGFLAFFILLLLTITSFNWAKIKLGGKRWRQLHRQTYLLPLILLFHAWGFPKHNLTYFIFNFGLLIILLGTRIFWYFKTKTSLTKIHNRL